MDLEHRPSDSMTGMTEAQRRNYDAVMEKLASVVPSSAMPSISELFRSGYDYGYSVAYENYAYKD